MSYFVKRLLAFRIMTEPRTYRNYYHGLMKRLDIPRLKYHGLRRSFATRCIESNCDYKTVSVLLGHANITTTINLYVHPNMEQVKDLSEYANYKGIEIRKSRKKTTSFSSYSIISKLQVSSPAALQAEQHYDLSRNHPQEHFYRVNCGIGN